MLIKRFSCLNTFFSLLMRFFCFSLLFFFVQYLYYFVFCHTDCPDDFQIVTNFPRRVLHCEPSDGVDPPTLEQLGLGKSEMLFIHDNEA